MESELVLLACVCISGLMIGGVIVGIAFVMLKDKKIDSKTEVLIVSGGSLSGGCISLVGATLVIIGFLLPWSVVMGVTLPINGITVSVSLILALFAILKTGTSVNVSGDLASLGFIVFFVVLIALILVVLIPIMGVKIGMAGYELIRLLSPSSYAKVRRREIAQGMIKFALIGLLPVVCYFSTVGLFNFNLSPLLGGKSGAVLGNQSYALWMMGIGFVISLAAGIMVSTLVALTTQMSQSETPHPLLRPKPDVRICLKCGKENNLSSAYCAYCGEHLSQTQPTGQEPPAQQPSATDTSADVPPVDRPSATETFPQVPPAQDS